MKIVFATNNKNKLSEIREILGSGFEVMSLAEIGCHEDIPETGDTLLDNAVQKARYVFEKYGYDCFADDTGLEVDALDGEPGVHSARYAEGTDHDSNANMDKLLYKLGDETRRTARFRTVIALLQKQQSGESAGEGSVLHIFEGGYDKTFAELGLDVKNQISHRARAVKKLADYLL